MGVGVELCTDLFLSQTGAKRSGVFPALDQRFNAFQVGGGGDYFQRRGRGRGGGGGVVGRPHIPSSIFRSCDNTPVSRRGVSVGSDGGF